MAKSRSEPVSVEGIRKALRTAAEKFLQAVTKPTALELGFPRGVILLETLDPS